MLLLNSHFVFQHNLRRLSNMKRLGGCWTIQKMDGWVDLGSRENPDIQRERETQDSVGREETLVATRARVFLQVWTHLLLRNTMPNFSVAPVPVPLVIIFIELEAKWQSLKLGMSDLPLRCWDCFCYPRHSCSRYHSHTWHQYIKETFNNKFKGFALIGWWGPNEKGGGLCGLGPQCWSSFLRVYQNILVDLPIISQAAVRSSSVAVTIPIVVTIVTIVVAIVVASVIIIMVKIAIIISIVVPGIFCGIGGVVSKWTMRSLSVTSRVPRSSELWDTSRSEGYLLLEFYIFLFLVLQACVC